MTPLRVADAGVRLLTPARSALLAALVAALLYLPALRNDFAYDDVAVVLQDTRVHGLDSIPSILTGGYWQDETLALWRPLTTLSFAVDWSLRPGDAAWFHGVNIFWHALATLLLTLLLARLCGPGAALAGGLLFAVHPVHVEAVANVVGRAELIAACAALGAALVWLPERQRSARTAAVGALYVIALGAKESAIVLPLLLVLLDLGTGALRRARLREWLRQRAADLLVLALVGVGYVIVRVQVLGSSLPSRIDPSLDITPAAPERIFTALQVWPHIVRLFFFPRTLLADYGPRILLPRLVPDAIVIGGALILLGLLGTALVCLARERRLTALALLWVPAALLPVSNFFFPIGVLLAERTLYLPSAALALGAALAVAWAQSRSRGALRATAAVGLVACGLLAARALVRIPEWRSTDAVFVSLLRDRPDAFYAHWHVARSRRASDPAAALEGYGRALSLWPYRERLVIESAAQAGLAGDTAFANRIITHGVQTWPQSLDIRRLAAALALERGDSATAKLEAAAGLRIDAADPTLLRMREAMTGRTP